MNCDNKNKIFSYILKWNEKSHEVTANENVTYINERNLRNSVYAEQRKKKLFSKEMSLSNANQKDPIPRKDNLLRKFCMYQLIEEKYTRTYV